MNSKLFITLMLASLLFAACSAGNTPTPTPEAASTVIADSTIIAEGRLEPVHYAEISFTATGRISDILVEEGQTVKKGEELIRLGDASDTQYAAAQLELVRAKKALTDLNNTAGTDLAQAVIDIKDAQEEYDDALDYLDYLNDDQKIPQVQTRRVLVQTARGYKYEERVKSIKGPAPEDWIIEAENDLALRKAELDDAQRTYERLKSGVDVEQLAVLEAQLDAAEAKLAAFSVIAPFDGMVADLNAKLGGSINAGERVVTVADFSQWLVQTTDLTEIDVVGLTEGQTVTVSLDAIPGTELKGEILLIGQTFAENQGDVVYEVTILLTDTHPAMRWGMTAAVNFESQD
jgi:multidrug efflux pump subunit AcrA (membrane-fusion protein)